MEAENSWIRRTKFSHTIYHRSGSARVDLVPFNQSGQNTGFVSRVRTGSVLQPSDSSVSEVQQSPSKNKVMAVSPVPHTRLSETLKEENFDQNKLSTRNPISDSVLQLSGAGATQIQRNSSRNKLRALSPPPQTNISWTFKKAKSDRKRFSTPQPARRDAEKGVLAKLLHKDSREKRAPVSKSNTNIGALRHLYAMKIDDKKKNQKESTWTKYFDLSKLFLGLKFDHGAYSRLYHGVYKDEPVAVKISRIPDDDENGDLRVKLEKQFTREVTLLSRLHHQNVIKALTARWMAPEMLKRKSYGKKVDISFGLILFEMVGGSIPYKDKTPSQAAFAVLNKNLRQNLRPVIPEDCPSAMKALIEQCWS